MPRPSEQKEFKQMRSAGILPALCGEAGETPVPPSQEDSDASAFGAEGVQADA
jgi:hypothetical protein